MKHSSSTKTLLMTSHTVSTVREVHTARAERIVSTVRTYFRHPHPSHRLTGRHVTATASTVNTFFPFLLLFLVLFEFSILLFYSSSVIAITFLYVFIITATTSTSTSSYAYSVLTRRTFLRILRRMFFAGKGRRGRGGGRRGGRRSRGGGQGEDVKGVSRGD
jgi:uncharacterized membrane protein YgcG